MPSPPVRDRAINICVRKYNIYAARMYVPRVLIIYNIVIFVIKYVMVGGNDYDNRMCDVLIYMMDRLSVDDLRMLETKILRII